VVRTGVRGWCAPTVAGESYAVISYLEFGRPQGLPTPMKYAG
jgi:hypothetical protein